MAVITPARERAATLAEERPIATLGAVWAVTFVFGFLINAVGSLVLEIRHDPLVTGYRDTLTFTSALIGDGILLPFVNAVIVAQLLTWRRIPRAREVVGAIFAGAIATLLVHLYQAANGIVNWTMPLPYAWTVLGYTHALFMWAELSFLAYFWTQVGFVARQEPREALQPRLLFVALCIAVFLRLLLADYGYL